MPKTKNGAGRYCAQQFPKTQSYPRKQRKMLFSLKQFTAASLCMTAIILAGPAGCRMPQTSQSQENALEEQVPAHAAGAVSRHHAKTEDISDSSAESTFNSRRAWKDLLSQTDIGPRNPGSEGAKRTREFLKKNLSQAGWRVREQKFTAATPLGPIQMSNIIAFCNADPQECRNGNKIVAAAHYDTKFFDKFPFIGANDGASGTAVLLELARVFRDKPMKKHSLVLCFFDGEEALAEWNEQDSLYGSRHFVKTLTDGSAPEGLNSENVAAAVILDMVGDKNLKITYETISQPQLMEMLFSRAGKMNFRSQFKRSNIGSAADDHIPFLMEKIPAIDIIGFNQTEDGVYPPYWHTEHDTVDKVSENSLQITGSVTDLFIRDLDNFLQ